VGRGSVIGWDASAVPADAIILEGSRVLVGATALGDTAVLVSGMSADVSATDRQVVVTPLILRPLFLAQLLLGRAVFLL